MKSIEVKSHTNNYKKKNKNKYQNNEPSRKEKKKKKVHKQIKTVTFHFKTN